MHSNKDNTPREHTHAHSLFFPHTLVFCIDAPVSVHSHGHFKLFQPLFLQLPGLKEEFEARVSLLVSHIEPVAPLWKSGRKTNKKKESSRKIFSRMQMNLCRLTYDNAAKPGGGGLTEGVLSV